MTKDCPVYERFIIMSGGFLIIALAQYINDSFCEKPLYGDLYQRLNRDLSMFFGCAVMSAVLFVVEEKRIFDFFISPNHQAAEGSSNVPANQM